jgi:signal transduction histidine kinase
VIALGARQVDVQRELHRLRVELEELRASRRRLVLAADADRRTIERDLHDGVHQHLISLAVILQLAGQAEGSDPAALPALLADMARAVHDGLEETARLAQRIHPATLEAGDLAALLRSASTAASVRARVDVSAAGSYPPEAVMTIHLAWLDTLARAGDGALTSIDVRDTLDTLTFEITAPGIGSTTDLDGLRGRVEALGGGLTITSSRPGAAVVSCSLPIER